jgi:hypothetical protein
MCSAGSSSGTGSCSDKEEEAVHHSIASRTERGESFIAANMALWKLKDPHAFGIVLIVFVRDESFRGSWSYYSSDNRGKQRCYEYRSYSRMP